MKHRVVLREQYLGNSFLTGFSEMGNVIKVNRFLLIWGWIDLGVLGGGRAFCWWFLNVRNYSLSFCVTLAKGL